MAEGTRRSPDLKAFRGVTMAITVRQAVDAALRYIKNFSDVINASDVRLEETIFDEQNDSWVITLSYASSPTAEGFRYTKRFVISNQSGDILSMLNR